MKSRRHHAFTLVEMVTSLAVASILLVAIGSAMVLAGRAIPSNESGASTLLSTSRVVDRIAGEVQFAIAITERTSRTIAFTIPDRTGDGKPEQVRYAWTGTAGGPLTRQFNIDTTVLIDSVQSLSFAADTVQIAETYPGPPVESAEQLLVAHMPATGTYTSADFSLDATNGCGQYIKPTLPANALTYSVTRVVFVAQKSGPGTEVIAVDIHKATAAKLPTGPALGSSTVLELSLSGSLANVSVAINGVTGVAANENLCLLLDNATNLLTAGRIEYTTGSGGNMILVSNGAFSLAATNSLRYQVYGKVVTPTTRTLTRTKYSAVRMSAQTTSDPAGRVDTAVALLNQPEALDACWSADFSENPITADRNGDSLADWRSGTGFDTGTLSAGVWRADREIIANPSNSFTSFTTFDIALRDSTSGGSGAGVEMRVEATALGHGIIEAYVARQADGTQTLTLQTRDLLLLPAVLTTVTNLPDRMVNLRLHVNPADDSVGVTVNGVGVGSFIYNRSVDLSDGFVRLFNTFLDGGAEFDSVRVRVGGTP